MKQHIEKTEQLINKIDSNLEDRNTNIEYDDKFKRMQLNVKKLNDWASDIKRRTENSQFSEHQEIAQLMYKLISTCDDIEQNIKLDEVSEIPLPKLKESLTNVKNAQEQSYTQACHSDIMDKILLLEESYQNGQIDAEKAVKQLSKLEKLEILQDDTTQSKQLKELIKNYKKEMGVTADSDKQYEQDVKLDEDLETIFSEMENTLDGKLNELISWQDSSSGYRPEFEDLCERVDIIIRDFVDAEGSLYDSSNLSNLYNEATKLVSQYNTACNEQQIKLNQSQEKRHLNQSLQYLIQGCDMVSQHHIPLIRIQSQLDKQDAQLKKFGELTQDMPSSVVEGSYKFLLTHYGNNLMNASDLYQQSKFSDELYEKCVQSNNSLINFRNNAQQLGIKI